MSDKKLDKNTVPDEDKESKRNPHWKDLKARDSKARAPEARDPRARNPKARELASGDPIARDPEARDIDARDPKVRNPRTRDSKARDPRSRDPKAKDLDVRDPMARDLDARDPIARDLKAIDSEVRSSETGDSEAKDSKLRNPLMKFKKKSLQKDSEDKKKKKKKKKKGHKKLKIFFSVCLVLLCILVIYGVFWYHHNVVEKAPDIDQLDVTPTGFLSTVVDSEGNEIATMVASGSNRVYMTLDEIPEDLQHAFVAIEDERFYKHHGVDFKGVIRAFFKGIKSGSFHEGASTITQQLLKNNVFSEWTSEKTFEERMERKLQEQYLAICLEKKESKEWILENYLNTINLGQNTLGVQSAAKRYFNKDVTNLSLSESAVIAGITKNPSAYNPIDHPEANAGRRKIVLEHMLDQGYITQKEYQEAISDEVYERIQTVNQEKTENEVINSYFVDALTEQVITDLMEKKKYSKTEAYKALYNGGLTIYSTQNSNIQKICEEEVNRLENYKAETENDAQVMYSISYQLTVKKKNGTYKNYNEQTLLKYYKKKDENYKLLYYSKDGAKAAVDEYRKSVVKEGDTVEEGNEKLAYSLQPQTSLTIIDQKSGMVLAVVGGRGDKEASRTLNRAVNTTRQPGSTFKILSTFAPALDTANKTLASVEDDAPYTYADGKTSVDNYDGRYRGMTTYREAIKDSINIVTVKALTDIGTQIGYDYLLRFGFTTLTEDDNRQTMALGGIKNGVTNLELTAAYATIANQGVYTKPRFYTKILDHDGNILIDNQPETKEVIKTTTAELLTNAMEDVLTDGSGKLANIEWMTLAGKSGTTTKSRDLWFAGYSPYYTCSVWGGYDNNYEQENTAYVKKIWKAVMTRIHEGYSDKEFETDGLVKCKICQKSGLRAREGYCDCDPRGDMVREEYFVKGTEPKASEVCNCHVKIMICKESQLPANSYCKDTEERVYFLNGTEGTEDSEYSIVSDALIVDPKKPNEIFSKVIMAEDITDPNFQCTLHKAPSYYSPFSFMNPKSDNDKSSEKNKKKEDTDDTEDDTEYDIDDTEDDTQETFNDDTEEEESLLEQLDIFHWFH